MKKNSKTPSFLIGAAIAGLMLGVATLPSCSGDASADSHKEKNGCNGPNGCGQNGHEAKKEANGCNGHNGCKSEAPAKKN